jgi:predicted nuclease of predicted toxin-antitoxin system
MASRPRLLFFLDQNAPDPLGKMLEGESHDVAYLRKHLATNAKDNVVAATAIERGAILISADKDFKGLARAAGLTRKQVHRLHRALIRCPDPEATKRFAEALGLIEFEWMRLDTDGVLTIEVHSSFIRTNR